MTGKSHRQSLNHSLLQETYAEFKERINNCVLAKEARSDRLYCISSVLSSLPLTDRYLQQAIHPQERTINLDSLVRQY
jgi:hypothetical protein